MAGFIIAGIAALILVIVLKVKVSLSEEELQEIGKAKNTQKEKERSARSLNTSRAADLLIQVLEEGTVDEIKQSMKNGINILQKLENNQTLLMIAVKNNPSVEVVQFLLNEGVEVNDVDDAVRFLFEDVVSRDNFFTRVWR